MISNECLDSLEDVWKRQLKTYDIEEGTPETLSSGEVTIDGKQCYWIESSERYEDGIEYWKKELFLPQNNDKNYVNIWIEHYGDENKDVNAFFEKLEKNIKFVGENPSNGNESVISRFGIAFPNDGWELSSCAYLAYEWSDFSNALIDFKGYEYGRGVDDAFEEFKTDRIQFDGQELTGSGDLDVDGIKGKWCSFSDSSLGGGSYCVLIPNNQTKQIVVITFNFEGNIKDHSKTIEKITKNIHFSDE